MLCFYLITFKLNCSKCLIRIKVVSDYVSHVRKHLHFRVRHMKQLVQKRKQLGKICSLDAIAISRSFGTAKRSQKIQLCEKTKKRSSRNDVTASMVSCSNLICSSCQTTISTAATCIEPCWSGDGICYGKRFFFVRNCSHLELEERRKTTLNYILPGSSVTLFDQHNNQL